MLSGPGEALTPPLAPGLPVGEYRTDQWQLPFLVGPGAQSGSVRAPAAVTGTVPDTVAADGATAPVLPGWLVAAGIGSVAGLGLSLAHLAVQRCRRNSPVGSAAFAFPPGCRPGGFSGDHLFT